MENNTDNEMDHKEEIALNQMMYRFDNSHSEEAEEYFLNFKPPKNSIIIMTYPKSGTTMTQQICHQLRSRGDMDFEEISYVVPNINIAYDYDVDIYKKQKFEPPLFKSHSSFENCPKNAKYIVVVRNPYDVANSFYHFHDKWIMEKKDLSIDTFVKKFFVNSKAHEKNQTFNSYFYRIINYYQNRHNKDVLWLHYEDFMSNFKDCILLIAEFMGIDTKDDELIDIAEKQSSREFMLSYKNKFNDAPVKICVNQRLGIKKYQGIDDGEAKVCEYNPMREKMSDSGREAIKNAWLEIVAPVTGYKSYDEMRTAINKEFNRKF